jgi:hypothetical protein
MNEINKQMSNKNVCIMKKIMLNLILTGFCFFAGTVVNAQVTAETEPSTTTGDIGTVVFNYGGVSVEYYTVRAADGRIWLQQNLGSTQVAESRTDTKSFGDLYNWGRWDDGHHFRDNTKINLAPADAPVPAPNNPTILDGTNPFYWSATNSGWWWRYGVATDKIEAASPEMVTATNGCDPCRKLMGGDWRMPTIEEWEALRVAEGITDSYTAFSSNLVIPSANPRAVQTGALGTNFNTTRMWSSTAAKDGSAYVMHLHINASSASTTIYVSRGSGFPIRCIKSGSLTTVLETVISDSKLTVHSTENNVKLSIQGKDIEVSAVRILSISGNELYKSTTNFTNEIQIPLTLKKGLYIASVTLSNDENLNVKFVK